MQTEFSDDLFAGGLRVKILVLIAVSNNEETRSAEISYPYLALSLKITCIYQVPVFK